MPNPRPLRVAVLASTRATTWGLMLDSPPASSPCPVEWVGLLTDRPTCGAVTRARSHGVPVFPHPRQGRSRTAIDQHILDDLTPLQPDIILMIGYMRIVSPLLTSAFAGRLWNVHPSLLPAHAGGMDTNVHQQVLDSGDPESGCTVHLVTPEVDAGRHLVQLRCPVLSSDTPQSLKDRIQQLEAQAFWQALTHHTTSTPSSQSPTA